MREYYRMQALNLNKVYRQADKEGKVDMIYKIYWDPKKLIKPLPEEDPLEAMSPTNNNASANVKRVKLNNNRDLSTI